MSRITTRLNALKEQGRKALIPYIVCGDPHLAITVPAMHGLVENGADIIELGVPFSDPMAEGPTIQHAHERALVHGTSLKDVLQVITEFRKNDVSTPIVIMGYANPIEVMGYQNFAQAAQAAGLDGVLTVDLPPEEAGELETELSKVDIDPIFLLAPTTTIERAAMICEHGKGYLYYVSFKGVTGANRLDIDSVAERMEEFRSLTSLPIVVGFGIKDGKTAAAVANVADGAVVGSVLVNQMGELSAEGKIDAEIIASISGILADMRNKMDS